MINPNIFLRAIPMGIFAMGIIMYTYIQPIYAGLNNYDYDPSYVYLLNGLSILNGVSPGHIDHPGTSMQLFCAILTAVIWLVARIFSTKTLPLDEFVFSNPEFILGFISCTMLLMNVLAAYHLGRVAYRVTGSLPAAAILQASPLLLHTAFFRIMYVNGEALSIFAVLLLMAIMLPELLGSRADSGRERGWVPVASGATIAIAATAKITFAPYVLFLLLLRTRTALGFLSFFLTAVVLLTPILFNLAPFVDWISNIVVHSGSYGHGKRQLVEWSAIPDRFITLFENFPMSISAIGLAIAAYLNSRAPWFVPGQRLVRIGARRLFGVLVVINALELMMVLKHFGVHYAMPIVILTGLVLVLATAVFVDLKGPSAVSFLSCVLVCMLVVSSWYYVSAFARLRLASQSRAVDMRGVNAAVAQYNRPIVIGSYRVPHLGYAFQFGLGYVAPPFAAKLSGSGDRLSYNIWNGKFSRPGIAWEDATYIDSLMRSGRPVLLILPRDVDIPALITERLFETSEGNRVLRVVGLNTR
jgi:hypothetical protein